MKAAHVGPGGAIMPRARSRAACGSASAAQPSMAQPQVCSPRVPSGDAHALRPYLHHGIATCGTTATEVVMVINRSGIHRATTRASPWSTGTGGGTATADRPLETII